mmetsp:Transcript_14019/g.42393  ORF Transcript_14019/g.42393 Transcript_14019/m.42393 type:complete len:212 (+) Transcript_14019:996-1631(+)
MKQRGERYDDATLDEEVRPTTPSSPSVWWLPSRRRRRPEGEGEGDVGGVDGEEDEGEAAGDVGAEVGGDEGGGGEGDGDADEGEDGLLVDGDGEGAVVEAVVGDGDAEGEDLGEEGRVEDGGEGGLGVAGAGDGGVGDEVADAVAPGEGRDAEDGRRETRGGAERLQDGDGLGRQQVQPRDGRQEPHEDQKRLDRQRRRGVVGGRREHGRA